MGTCHGCRLWCEEKMWLEHCSSYYCVIRSDVSKPLFHWAYSRVLRCLGDRKTVAIDCFQIREPRKCLLTVLPHLLQVCSFSFQFKFFIWFIYVCVWVEVCMCTTSFGDWTQVIRFTWQALSHQLSCLHPTTHTPFKEEHKSVILLYFFPFFCLPSLSLVLNIMTFWRQHHSVLVAPLFTSLWIFMYIFTNRSTFIAIGLYHSL